MTLIVLLVSIIAGVSVLWYLLSVKFGYRVGKKINQKNDEWRRMSDV